MSKKFIELVSSGEFQKAEELLVRGTDINKLVDGSTALHYEARTSLRGVRWLIDHDACLDALDQNACTPLMVACIKGGDLCEKIVFCLMDAGADVSVRRQTDKMSAIEFAAKKGSAELIRRLIQRGALVDGPEDFRQTPAMIAARADNIDAFATLVELGADVSKECRSPWAKGLTCMQIAIQEKSKKQ